MRRESLLSPERTWVIMKVVAVGLVPRSSWGRRVVPLSGPGRGGRGGALGITLELHFASSFLWKCFCTVPPSPHHVLWCQGPRRRGPAAEESGAAGASARRPVSVRCSVLLPARLPHRPALAREHAPPPSRSLLLPLVCCRPLLNFSNTRISRPSTPASCDIRLSRDFPDRLRCEPCEVMHSVWTAFCSRNSVSGVVAFTALPVTTMHLSWCDPSRLL